MTDSIQPQPYHPAFDERSALEELEQLADKIQRSRQQREQKVAEFDAFVRTFRHDRYAASIAATDRERRADDRSTVVSAATRAAGAGGAAASVGTPFVALPAAAPDDVPDAAERAVAVLREPVAQAVAVPSRRPRAANIGVSLAALAVVAVSALLWRSATAPVGPVAHSNAPTVPPASTAPAPQVAAPTAAPLPAGPPRALNIEFVTIRPVWARVTVDGRRAMEREFNADQRILFGADRAIAIRAGDAGAIRLIVDGKDLGVLGRDGQVFDRSFVTQTPR